MNHRPFTIPDRAGSALAVSSAALAASGAALAASVMSFSILWLVPLALATLYLVYEGHLRRIEEERHNCQQMVDLHLATIEALAGAIDAKDQTAPEHIRRVQAYAAGLARTLGMTDSEVQAVRTAALLRDIGKLAIPEHILAKPGPLTPEEFQKVQIHPEVGAEILRSVPFPYPVTPLILSHHERWDGRGYPSGLKEDAIPLGARVVCIADYFVALTSDRPYHKAISPDAAVALLQQEAGKALDPRIVDVFVNALPRLAADTEDTDTLDAATAQALRAAGPPRPRRAKKLPDGPRASVFDDIAHAHREIYALYQISQAMGTSLGLADTMSLVAAKLSSLVPFSACALFVYSESTERLHCRFATGTDSELMQQIEVRTGQGLNGWVARNRRPLVNARPSADLEAMGSNAPTVLQSALVCPLAIGERLIGTLAVYHVEPSFYREDHRRLLERVCEQAGAVVHNSVIFEQTQEDSLTDPLTGLPNTRSLFNHLTRELARAERLKSEVALVVMDLNDFKEINDHYGHQFGDVALRQVGNVLRATIRPYDMCVRYAGDEFIVVLSGCAPGEAEHKRAELQNAIGGIVIEAPPGERVTLSISAGVAVYPHDGETYETLLTKADARMYSDKSSRKGDTTRRFTLPTAITGGRA
jgi:diguanylate cyclase (GGDEF)-like protein/putative nucleotidyltransferase with HDIG domain